MNNKSIKYFLAAILTFVAVVFFTEMLLGIIFLVKDHDLERMRVKDFPYLYYLFEQEDGLNAHGLKTNYTKKKEPGKYRIILTGGSVARGKAPHETIAAHLEDQLKKRLNSEGIEVVNAGVSAFVLEQEFILIQMVLQHYKPEMIVSLDGYNDMMTFKFNRIYELDFPLPPHNWKEFRVIETNRHEGSFSSRFTAVFKNIDRSIEYLKRRSFEKNFDWGGSLADKKMHETAESYAQILTDTYDFCRAKNIAYKNFLQPMKWYGKCGAYEDLSGEELAMCSLYRILEIETEERPYGFSLASSLNENTELFTDDCHVNAEGNRIIAEKIADRITDEIRTSFSN